MGAFRWRHGLSDPALADRRGLGARGRLVAWTAHHGLDADVEVQHLQQRLADVLLVVGAAGEPVAQTCRGEAEHQPARPDLDDAGLRGDEAPRGALEAGERAEDDRPHRPDAGEVVRIGAGCDGLLRAGRHRRRRGGRRVVGHGRSGGRLRQRIPGLFECFDDGFSGRPRRGRRDGRGRGGHGHRHCDRHGHGPGAAAREPALHALEPGREGRVVPRGAGQQDPRADELELQPRCGRAPHLGETGVDDVGRSRQLRRTEAQSLPGHLVELVVGQVREQRRARIGHRGQDDQVAQPLEHVLGEAAGVEPALDHRVDDREDRRPVVRCERVDGGVEQRGLGVAEQRGRQRPGHARLPRTAHELVEDRQCVAHGALARAYDHREHPTLDGHRLALAQLAEIGLQSGRRDEPERVVMGAGADGSDDLVWLRRREDELHVLRRLLDDLEQRVEARRRDHVRLVDDVDLEARGRR